MPFTATHVAAVLPFAWLCRWRLPLSALAIGSMVPDFGSYFPGLVDYSAMHTLRGVITHSVPLGLIGFYLFHLLLKQPMVDLLPGPIASRLGDWRRGEMDVQPARLVVVAACVAFGAMTHVVWDSFTHGWGRGVAMFPILDRGIVEYDGRMIPAHALLQHGSSLLLLPPMTLGFVWWVMRQPQVNSVNSVTSSSCRLYSLPRSVSWTVLAMIAIGGWIYFQSLLTIQVEITWVSALRMAVKQCGAVAILTVLAYCLGMHLTWWYQSRRRDGETTEPDLRDLADGRQYVVEPAHNVSRSRRPSGASHNIMIVDGGHRPLDSGPGASTDARF